MFPTIAEHAFTWTAAVFLAETLAFRSGGAATGAARHGARLLLLAAVFGATRRSRARVCVAGATCKLARSARAMLVTHTACSR